MVEVGWMILIGMVRFEGIVARIRLGWLMGFEGVLVFCFFLWWDRGVKREGVTFMVFSWHFLNIIYIY